MAVNVVTGGATLSSTAGVFTVSAQTPCTLVCWLRANDSTVWAARVSMAGVYGPASPTTAMQLGCWNANTLGVWTWGGNSLVASTGYTPPVGTWIHCAVTYDGTSFRLYINGALNNTAASTQLAGNLGQTFINGFPTGGTSETGNFQVDDFMFFNRTLSQNEILTIMTAEGPRDGIVQGCMARYTYEEGAVGAAVVMGVDISPNKAHMTQGVGTTATYYAPRATSNLRRVQT